MLLIKFLQLIVTFLVAGDITRKLSKDIYKTKQKQKTREGLLELNWTIPNISEVIENKFFQFILLINFLENKYFQYILFINFLGNKFSRIFKWVRSPQTKYSIEATGGIIVLVVLGIILTGVILKKFSP
jgi:hypothetical protein